MTSAENVADATIAEARERSREAAERLAVKLRWISLLMIPAIVLVSGEPLLRPWFESAIVLSLIYNGALSLALARGASALSLSLGTSVIDSMLLLAMTCASGGIHSPVLGYLYLSMVSVCMRLSVGVSIVVGVVYASELAFLAWLDGGFPLGLLVVGAIYVFLTILFVTPLAQEARTRFAEALAGQQAQRMLLHRLLRTGEDERRRVASELHDRGGGALFSLLYGLRRLREFVHPRDAEADAEVASLIRVTESTVNDLRALLADLRPRLIDDLGLAEALRELLSRERALSGIPVSLEVEDEEQPDSESALALYRVAQEAFTNIRRHAQAKEANVRLGKDEGGWTLAVEDDGRGLNGNRSGLGLRTMRERIEALGGRLEIQSAPGAGTKIWAWVPGEVAGEVNGDSSFPR